MKTKIVTTALIILSLVVLIPHSIASWPTADSQGKNYRHFHLW